MKTRVGTEMTKEEEAYGIPDAPAQPQPMAPPPQTTVVFPQQVQQADFAGATCWYVLGILSTIFCCLPCGVIGLVHAMIAKHEGERGNLPAHRRRMHQAKCWTSWSIGLGVFVLILLVIWAVVATTCFGLGWNRMGRWDDDDMVTAKLLDYVIEEDWGKDTDKDWGKDMDKDLGKDMGKGWGHGGGHPSKPPYHGDSSQPPYSHPPPYSNPPPKW